MPHFVLYIVKKIIIFRNSDRYEAASDIKSLDIKSLQHSTRHTCCGDVTIKEILFGPGKKNKDVVACFSEIDQITEQWVWMSPQFSSSVRARALTFNISCRVQVETLCSKSHFHVKSSTGCHIPHVPNVLRAQRVPTVLLKLSKEKTWHSFSKWSGHVQLGDPWLHTCSWGVFERGLCRSAVFCWSVHFRVKNHWLRLLRPVHHQQYAWFVLSYELEMCFVTLFIN